MEATDKALKAAYTSLVVSGVFSPVNRSQEQAAAEIIQQHVAMNHNGTLFPDRPAEWVLCILHRSR